MILHAENRFVPVPESLECLIIQVAVRNLDIRIAQRIRVHTEAVIL